MKKNDKAIAIVHFGTSHPEAAKKTMSVMEEELRQMYPEHVLRTVYTNETVRRILRRSSTAPLNLAECLEDFAWQGVREVTLLFSHVLEGVEYERLQGIAKKYRPKFDSLRSSRPLLSEDLSLQRFAEVVMEIYPEKEGEMKLFMGHGTVRASDAVYRKLEEVFSAAGYPARIATLEGKDLLEDVLPTLPPPQEVHLALIPLLYVAGDHARNDMVDNSDSYFHTLKSRGYKINAQIIGLGEWPQIRSLYYSNLEEAL